MDHSDRATLEAQMRNKWESFTARAIEDRVLAPIEALHHKKTAAVMRAAEAFVLGG